MKIVLLAAICATLVTLVACALPSEVKSDGGSMLCAPNDQKECPCEDGGMGVQTCAQDGMSYSVCSCQAAAATACDKYLDTIKSCYTPVCQGKVGCAVCDAYKQAMDGSNPNPGEPDEEACRKANASFNCADIESAITAACQGGGKDGGPGGECTYAGDACNGGVCISGTGGTLACYSECTVVGDVCKGMDGGYLGACYLYGAGNRFACMPTGSKGVGEACGTANDCIAGAQCLDQGGMLNCYQICVDTCDAGDCVDTELGFKVCVASEGQTQTISGTVVDHQTRQPVANANVALLDDDTGVYLGLTAKSGSDGTAIIKGIPAGVAKVGVKISKMDNMDTIQYHFTAGSQNETFLLLSQTTVSLIAGILGVTLDPAKGVAAGSVYWGSPGYETAIGCATVENYPLGGETHYMDNSGIPIKTRDEWGTNPANGYFTTLNMTPGKITITAKVNGRQESTVLPELPANSVTISNVYFSKVKYPANPQAAGCQ